MYSTLCTYMYVLYYLFLFTETLRMHPAGSVLRRRAQSNYTFNGTKVSIHKGMMIWIPLYGIHYDPDIYPNPKKFDPERFNEDAVAARHRMHYLPFGDGPRNCIGMLNYMVTSIRPRFRKFLLEAIILFVVI